MKIYFSKMLQNVIQRCYFEASKKQNAMKKLIARIETVRKCMIEIRDEEDSLGWSQRDADRRDVLDQLYMDYNKEISELEANLEILKAGVVAVKLSQL